MQVTPQLRTRRDAVPPPVERAAHAVEQLGNGVADALRTRSRTVARKARDMAIRSREIRSEVRATAMAHPIATLAGCFAVGALVAAVFRRR